jgi:acyl-coenzyme A synthetase/AMP-(fatty) acid ligase
MTAPSVLELFHRGEMSARVALVDRSAAYTYGETAAAIDRVAAGLWALGVRKGDRIGIYVTNTPQLVQLTFAAWRLGAITVFVDTFHAIPTAMAWWNDTGVTCVVIDESLLEAAAPHLPDLAPGKRVISTGSQVAPAHRNTGRHKAVPGVLPWQTLLDGHPPPPPVTVEDSDQLLVIRTSGTTARPKGICHSLHNLNARLRSHLSCPPLSPDDVACPMARLTTVPGLNAVMLPALAVGARVIMVTNMDPVAALELVVDMGATLVMVGPALVHRFLHVAETRPELTRTRLRFAMTGGDKMPIPLRRAWDETFGVPLLDGFGYSETLGGVLINRLDDADHAGNVGHPFPDVEVRLVDEDGHDVPDGTAGEMWLKADFLFTGYLDEPERTRAALVDGWFRTGDYLTRDASGRYHPLGRRDFQIMCGTLNVSPVELESIILNDDAIADCMVAGFPHEVLGQEIGAFLVLREPRTLEQVKNRVLSRVGPLMCPAHFWTVAEIPRTGPGKVDRRAAEQLRARAAPLA